MAEADVLAAIAAVQATLDNFATTQEVAQEVRDLAIAGAAADSMGAALASVLADTGTDGVVLAADAITAAKIADDAIAAEHIAAGAIVAGTFAAGAIDAAAIAAGAIDQATFAVDVYESGIKKNVALTAFPFWMYDAADHVTGMSGLTVTAARSIDGGAFAACANSPTAISGGAYKINLANTDLNGDTIMLKFTAALADDTVITIKTTS